jgi:hypothetical protein
MAKLKQTPETNFETAALDWLAEGASQDPRAIAIGKALTGSRLLDLIEAVPFEGRSRAPMNARDARNELRTEAARQLFDDLLAEGMRRVRFNTLGRKVATMMASAIALHADEMALRAAQEAAGADKPELLPL